MPLVYFYPHTIQELIRGLAQDQTPAVGSSIDFPSGILLARYLMKKGFFEKKPIASFSGFECFLSPRYLRNERDFLALAAEVSGRARKIRETISFTGGSSPSTAVHIYTPHQELPRLLARLSDFFNDDWSEISPIHAVAAVFYYSLSMHPFSDGNGRWARHLAIAAAHKVRDAWLSVTMLVFFAQHERHIVSMWKQAEISGLDRYMQECVLNHKKLSARIPQFSSHARATKVFEAILAQCERRQAEKIFCSLAANGSLNAKNISTLLQCSQKKSTGILAKLLEMDGYGHVESGIEEFSFQSIVDDFNSDIEKNQFPD